MDNQEIQVTLDRYWEATMALDLERVDEFNHEDIVVEFPQSGERILGKHNIHELRAHYPAKVTFKILRTRGEGNLWITELIITYDGRPVNVVSVMEFKMGRLHTKRITMQIHSNHLSGGLNGSRGLNN